MRKLITATFAITMLLAAASCGSDDDSSSTTTSGSDLSDPKQAVLDQTIAAAAAAGITIDRDCFAAVVAQLSDEDAQLIADAGPSGDPTLSPEGEQLGSEAAKCVDTSSLPVSSDPTATT